MSVTPEMSRIARGAMWSTVGTIASQVMAFAATIIAARALTPEEFGVVGMGTVGVTVLSAIRDLGVTPAIASGRVDDEDATWTTHWLLCLFGIATFGAVFGLAPLVARFFENGLVGPVLRVQAVALALGSAVAVPQALLVRGSRFAALAGIAMIAQALVLGGITVGVALDGGIWALVVPNVVAPALVLPIYWRLAGGPPRRVFAIRKAGPVVREGLRVCGSSLSNIVTRNADNAIIGRINGAPALGLYMFAYGFLMQPLGLFSHAIVPVLLPAFGRLNDSARRSDGTVRVVLSLLRLGAPFMVGGALTASLFVPLIFGARWTNAVPLVQILMLLGAVQIVGPVFGSLTLALGHASFALRFGVVATVTAVIAFLVGAVAAGPLGVAVAYVLHTVVLVAVMYAVTRNRFGLALSGLGSGLLRITRDVAIMAAVVTAIDLAARAGGAGAAGVLVADVLAGAIAYVAAVRLLSQNDAALLLSLLPKPVGVTAARLLGVSLIEPERAAE